MSMRKTLCTGTLKKAAALSVCFCLAAEPFAAFAAGDGVTYLYDEAYYAVTDCYGNLTEGSVVKSYTMNGIGRIEDYGKYDEIRNLTDDTEAAVSNGVNVFEFDKDNIPGHFYFEGKTSEPYESMPWEISVRYRLNGLPVTAEKLAGEKGVIEIITDVIPRKSASEYAKNNYTLEAMAIFNQDEILSLEAPGAQVQLLGNLRAVLFVAFPGEEGHFSISVGTENFSFSGMTVAMMPATLSQIAEVSKLSSRKDKIKEHYDSLTGSLDKLMDSVSKMGTSLDTAADGLDKLNQSRAVLHAKRNNVYGPTDALVGDLKALDTSLSGFPGHIDKAQDTVNITLDAVSDMNDSLHKLSRRLDLLTRSADSLRGDLGLIADSAIMSSDDLEELGDRIDEIELEYDELLKDISEFNLSIRGDKLDFTENVDGVDHRVKIDEGAISGKGEITISQDGVNMSVSEIRKNLNQAKTLHSVYAAVGQGGELDLAHFIASLSIIDASQKGTTLDPETAIRNGTQIAGLVKTVDDNIAQLISQGIDAGTAKTMVLSSLSAENQAYYNTGSGLRDLFAAITGGSAFSGTMNEKGFYAAVIYKSGSYGTDISACRTAGGKLYDLRESGSSFDTGAAELIDLLGSNDGNGTGLAGNLSDLLYSTGTAMTCLDDVSYAAQRTMAAIDELILAFDDITAIAQNNRYEIQETLRNTRNAVMDLTAAVNDTSTLAANLKDMIVSAGELANDGAEKSLTGLSEVLRDASEGVNGIDDVRAAKEEIQTIIEDTWDDYTGRVNNLLNMDAEAETQSLTDVRNPSPTSIQILIRTGEIKAGKAAGAAAGKAPEEQTTLGQRIARLFTGYYDKISSAVKGIFGKGE